MRFAPFFLFGAFSMLVSAHTVRLDACGQAYCMTQTIPLTNFTAQAVSVWEEHPRLGVAVNAFAENVATWFSGFVPAPEKSVEVVREEPKAAKKATGLHRDLSVASYVRGLRGLSSYEYTPVEVQPIAAEDLVIAPER